MAKPRCRWRAVALAAALGVAPAPVAAHPHVFIDGGVDFLFDDAGRLAELRVTWIYDPLSSLFMLEDLGIAADAEPAPAERAALAAYQTEWIEGYEGDSYLWRGATRVGLSGPREAAADLRDGRVVVRFLRSVEAPFRPGDGTVVKIYDPTYYSAYFVTEAPALEGAAEGCGAEVVNFEPSAELAELQQSLLSLPPDATPADPDVGARFAERVFVTCD